MPGFIRAPDPLSIRAGRTGRTVSIRWFAGSRVNGGVLPRDAFSVNWFLDAGDSARLMYPPY
jgi:hypothetical protein